MSQDFTPTEQPSVQVRKHSGCLTAWLALAVVGNALFGLFTLVTAADIDPSMQLVVIISGFLNLASVGFAIAIYKWKKWGVYGYVTAIGITMLLNFILGDPVSALRGLIPAAFLLALIGSSWKHME